MVPELTHVDAWIFDLDNTLYPARANLFALIDERMGLYIQNLLACDAAEARRVQKGYFVEHGTTLSGLMATHGTDPREFLEFVHDIELDRIGHDAALVANVARLPGRKLVFTNGDAPYARRVLDRLGLGEAFEAVHDIHAMDYVPKPSPASYGTLCGRWDIASERALFVDDMARNLKPAKALGMTTVWLNNGSEQARGQACPSFVDYEVVDLGDWLEAIQMEDA